MRASLTTRYVALAPPQVGSHLSSLPATCSCITGTLTCRTTAACQQAEVLSELQTLLSKRTSSDPEGGNLHAQNSMLLPVTQGADVAQEQ